MKPLKHLAESAGLRGRWGGGLGAQQADHFVDGLFLLLIETGVAGNFLQARNRFVSFTVANTRFDRVIEDVLNRLRRGTNRLTHFQNGFFGGLRRRLLLLATGAAKA